MGPLNIRPGDKLIKNYYDVLHQHSQLEFDHEGAVRSAFEGMLRGYGNRLQWTLVTEFPYKKVRVDGALVDTWRQRRGFWEAKDVNDNLEKEIRKKIDAGYPTNNIIFQRPERAILFQHGGRIGLNEDIEDPKNLVTLLEQFFSYKEPEIEEWEDAVARFKEELPEIARRAQQLIEQERISSKAFRDRFEEFYDLCRRSINPNLSIEAVEEMLTQHLLTERIFRRVFHAEEFRSRNVIAQEIEKVIVALTKKHFSRDAFLKHLDHFYKAIERSADIKTDYAEKQDFLNTVYERFFQGYSPKEADTHGIVYTPQPIVDFMVRSVEDILKTEFGKSLSDKGVHILDPFVGTGNFIVRVMREMKKSALPYKYENELHCNEVMLLPYYIASMNIEHEYFEKTGEYRPFPGICLVDTFELAETNQGSLSFMTEENTARVKRQKESPIFVVIGNPPYNVGQASESDQNKNRPYPEIDRRVRETYGRRSKAMNTRTLSDYYVRAIRWASDRVGNEGVVAFVSNGNFVDALATDGMRASIGEDFDHVYVVDLGGNVRKNPKLSGTTHNVFGIQVGVAISLFVKLRNHTSAPAQLSYVATDEWWRKEQKLSQLESWGSLKAVPWISSKATATAWKAETHGDIGPHLLLLSSSDVDGIFRLSCRGAETARDEWVYNFSREPLVANVQTFIQFYGAQVVGWKEAKRDNKKLKVDDFIQFDDRKIKWSSSLRMHLGAGTIAQFADSHVRKSLYRPFATKFQYFDEVLTHRQAAWRRILPSSRSENENRVISFSDVGLRSPFSCLGSSIIPDFHLCATADTFRAISFYTYDEDGTNRRENVTDWALNEFRTHYKDQKIGKWDIFHYVYGVLHSPEYRERYAANLKRELPRIPFAPDFWGFAKAGERLADLHVNYEKQPEYPLQRIENPKEKLSYRVEKMRLSKDKTLLVYNQFWTLSGIPPETYEYRLGNRSALEWIVDQYQISTDKRSGITNDPNREDDEEYILRLIGQVVYVSLETVKSVKLLPELGLRQDTATGA